MLVVEAIIKFTSVLVPSTKKTSTVNVFVMPLKKVERVLNRVLQRCNESTPMVPRGRVDFPHGQFVEAAFHSRVRKHGSGRVRH
jgi:hypothetical protein